MPRSQKIIALVMLFQLAWIPASLAQESQQFLVTAYYSPLPNQTFYIRGSYEGDVALNGQGTHGADGTAVYSGMLAAPEKYPFGTQISIPGLGVGEVHDRGGAILEGADYDRIDVWMGYGEEGLSRALNWGARLVEGLVYGEGSQVQSGFNYDWVDPSLPESTVTRLQASTTQIEQGELQDKQQGVQGEVASPSEETTKVLNDSVLEPGFGHGAEGESVKQLQQLLSQVGYFQADLTGIYDAHTVNAVFKLQRDEGVLRSESEPGAGYFGPKTHEALLSVLNQGPTGTESTVAELPASPPSGMTWEPPENGLPVLKVLNPPETVPVRNDLGFEEFHVFP